MTIIRGRRILAAPCCGARYTIPHYVSVHYSAFKHWTDGWRDFSLMPNDTGLRHCQCGQFFLLKRTVDMGIEDSSELPLIQQVRDEDLAECISLKHDVEIEVAARRAYWWHLNHKYRDKYRQHRDAEEGTTKEKWESTISSNRNWIDRFFRRKSPIYSRSPDSPFTWPAFEPTIEQLENMKRLSDILSDREANSKNQIATELAELFREQSAFSEAELAINDIGGEHDTVATRLILKLIHKEQSAPMRFRM